eukprot:TRINITY_DN14467_c0_g1_i1.p1 TRINITY_DN14467_c0_g1~~TRINITY_DN14467_c0_g1_i1.p1  ORF type:complete len:145 (-),score=45.10 TRINITY_DN14467_c0_g1_i1:37-441(-)
MEGGGGSAWSSEGAKFVAMFGGLGLVGLYLYYNSTSNSSTTAKETQDGGETEKKNVKLNLNEKNSSEVVVLQNCSTCKKEAATKKCSYCKTVSYCNPTCQKKDWPRHKQICNMITDSTKPIPNPSSSSSLEAFI